MAGIFQWVGFALISALLAVFVRERHKEAGLLISVAAGLILFLTAARQIQTVYLAVDSITAKAGVDISYLSTVMKVMGVAYLTEFGSQICKDAGENAIGSKLEMCGKIMVLILSLPIFSAALDMIFTLIP
jgi:stage III sporulation protein AD